MNHAATAWELDAAWGVDKASARAAIRRTRRAWTNSSDFHPVAAGQQLADHITRASIDVGAATVALYLAYPSEPPTAEAIRRLKATGRRVLIPVTLPDLDLSWALVEHLPASDLVRECEVTVGSDLGMAGINQADLILTPGLAVDASGTRLGQGGGSYDRALPRRAPGVPIVTVVHEHELLPAGALPRQAHDVGIDAVMRPSGIHWFTQPENARRHTSRQRPAKEGRRG